MANQTDEMRDVLTDASRTQFAAVSAAVTFWSEWAESAASYSRGMADELTRISVEKGSAEDALGRMVDLNREYLRRVTELPNTAVQRFNEEIAKIEQQRTGTDTGGSTVGKAAPKRRARAKA
jgi:hypothetical protein